VLQTRLERRHNVFVAALLAAVPFGLAHWPLAFLGQFTAASAAISLVAYIVLGALVRPLAGLVMRGARDSVLAFALVHTLFNRTNNPDGIPGTLLDGQGHAYGLLVVLLLLTGTVALILRRRLGAADRIRLDDESSAAAAAGTLSPQGSRSGDPDDRSHAL
jgi:membrane protease YdiL (CAAX protease family)